MVCAHWGLDSQVPLCPAGCDIHCYMQWQKWALLKPNFFQGITQIWNEPSSSRESLVCFQAEAVSPKIRLPGYFTCNNSKKKKQKSFYPRSKKANKNLEGRSPIFAVLTLNTDLVQSKTQINPCRVEWMSEWTKDFWGPAKIRLFVLH